MEAAQCGSAKPEQFMFVCLCATEKSKFFSLSIFPKSLHAFPDTVGFLTLLKLPPFHYVAAYK